MKAVHARLSIAFLCSALFGMVISSSTNSTFPKRGLIYIPPSDDSDYEVFTLPNSPLSWYYSYSPWPVLTEWDADFAPMIHGPSTAEQDVDTIKAVLNGSAGVSTRHNTISHVLTFNEPDGSTDSGGSDATPAHAARVFIDTFAPLRRDPWNLQVGLPATTGTSAGMQWLQEFNASCHRLSRVGCEVDFVATHYYGDFAGLASWLGQLHDVYPNKPVWVTEIAVAALAANDTQAFMDQALPYLDGLDFVQRYAWFGTFRTTNANSYTGDGVSMLDGQGKLTALGADYLGGQRDGFAVGQGATQGTAVDSRARSFSVLMLGLSVAFVGSWWW